MIKIIEELIVLMTLQMSLLSPVPADLPLGAIDKIDKQAVAEKFIDAPKEIKDKYVLEDSSLKLVAKADPKDKIEVKVGGDTEFEPKLKIERWDEVDFSVRLKETEAGTPALSFDKEKIIWEKGNIKIEYYDYEEGEGGYKMVWYLKSDPRPTKTGNYKLEFSLQSKGLNFYRQPPLTEEYQSGYSEEFQKEIVVSETQVKDLEGNVLVECPENVVGSYAVYHQTKGGMNDINGKDYKVGKAFHIYRPKIIDAVGKETWGILHISDPIEIIGDTEIRIYSVEIPQEFLDKAVCPIKSNDNFGYETAGGSTTYDNALYLSGSLFQNTSGSGAVQSMTAYISRTSGVDDNIKFAIYATNYDLVASTEAVVLPASSTNWRTGNLTTNPDVTLNTSYHLLASRTQNETANSYMKYDTGSAGQFLIDTGLNYASFPEDPLTPSHPAFKAYKSSIYATYTPAGTERRIIITQ